MRNDSTFLLKAQPGKLDDSRREYGILFISLQATSDYEVIIDFCVDSVSLATSFKRHHDLIKAYAVR